MGVFDISGMGFFFASKPPYAILYYTYLPCITMYPIIYTGWWFGTFFIFPYIGNFIIPTDEVHHFSEG
jgi:hypothetical protein